MEDIKLSLSQSGPSGELSVIRVDGVVDTITASDLEQVIASLVGQSKYKIIVDLGGVEYISSAGWGIFISRIQEIRDHGGDIKLVNMIPNVYEIYELLEFDNIIPVYETLETGKKAFNLPSDVDPNGEKIWKTDRSAVPEPGMAIQSAMSPGRRGSSETRANSLDDRLEVKPRTSEELIIALVIEDPFRSIGELKQEMAARAPELAVGWWKIWGILRANGILSRRARFQLARRNAR